MKILVAGDLHLTDKRPDSRTDDYRETVLRKFRFLLDTANKNNCEMIVQPGDFSDSPSLPYDLFVDVLEAIKKSRMRIVTTWGQHDLRYRSKSNTFLGALQSACQELILLEGDQTYSNDLVQIYASAWGEKIPNIKEEQENKIKILVTHRMLIQEKLWEGQEQYQAADSFLDSNDFDLIISGDNHKTFTCKVNGKILLNGGSMLRSNISQVDHQPVLFIFGTEAAKIKKINIPIAPAEEVFRMERSLQEKERNEKLDSFVKGLSNHKSMELSFMDNLHLYLKKNNVSEEIKTIIEECQNG